MQSAARIRSITATYEIGIMRFAPIGLEGEGGEGERAKRAEGNVRNNYKLKSRSKLWRNV